MKSLTNNAIALRDLSVSVVRAGNILQREAGRLFRPLEITAAQFNVFNLLGASSDGLRATEITQSLVVDPSSTTYLVDQLEKRGWAKREPDPDDRRAMRILLTSEGRDSHRKLVSLYHLALQQMSESFSKEELSAALPFLEKLPTAAVEAVNAACEAQKGVTTKKRRTR